MPITIYPGSMKKRNANGSYSDLVPAIATDPEVLDDFAEEYSTSETYNIGDYCIHNSDLYKCNTNNTTGTWNNNAWDRVSVADELVDHKNTLNQLENGLAIQQTGNTASRSIPARAFIYLTGNSDQTNLPDGIYQNTSGSAIGSGATFTTSNLTRCYQETGALNTLNNHLTSNETAQTTKGYDVSNAPLTTENDFAQFFAALYDKSGLFRFSWLDTGKNSAFASSLNATNGFAFVLNNNAWMNHPLVYAFAGNSAIYFTSPTLTASGYTMGNVWKVQLTT